MYFGDILQMIERYFMSMVPGPGTRSRSDAAANAQSAREILFGEDNSESAVASHQGLFGPRTERHVVNVNAENNRTRTPTRQFNSQLRQRQYDLNPTRMPSGVRMDRRRSREMIIDPDTTSDSDEFPGTSSGYKKRYTKPKPKKHLKSKTKGKKLVSKRK